MHSAAPCPLEVKKQMMAWWGPVIWETYGGMEGAATIAKPYRWLEKPGTVGRSVAGMSVKILDEDGNELPRGEVGHVYLEPQHGPSFAYRNDPELTASVSKGNAFTLGDVGFMDEDGYLFIHDRAKDMIISGGVNIYPAEVEGVLSGHPRSATSPSSGPRHRMGGAGQGRRRAGRRREPRATSSPRSCSPTAASGWRATSARAASTSGTICRVPTAASSTSACCATSTGPAAERNV